VVVLLLVVVLEIKPTLLLVQGNVFDDIFNFLATIRAHPWPDRLLPKVENWNNIRFCSIMKMEMGLDGSQNLGLRRKERLLCWRDVKLPNKTLRNFFFFLARGRGGGGSQKRILY